MTAASAEDHPTAQPASAPEPPARPMEWKRAWKALGRLIEDPKRTDEVFEIIDSLAGNSFERQWKFFGAQPVGQRLLRERPSLLATLADREALRELPPGSLGRAYLDFMTAGGLTAEGLVAAEMTAAERNPNQLPADPDREYLGDRMRDMHDLWHVLTGYGMDEAGEAANLAFTLGQIPTPGFALIVLAAALLGPKDVLLTWPRYLFRAWRRGVRAERLCVVPYEELLALPLDEVRRRLKIDPPQVAHPEGIIVASRVADASLGQALGGGGSPAAPAPSH
jgi:ubiquinone biosynthesis protein COQ4